EPGLCPVDDLSGHRAEQLGMLGRIIRINRFGRVPCGAGLHYTSRVLLSKVFVPRIRLFTKCHFATSHMIGLIFPAQNGYTFEMLVYRFEPLTITVHHPWYVYGGFSYEVTNDKGCSILEYVIAHDVVGANSFFKKRDAHLITFKSGGHNIQIDYLLVRKGDLKACKDCRAFPGEAFSSNNRLVALDAFFERQRHRREANGVEDLTMSDADQMWNTIACTMRDITKDALSVASGSATTRTTRRESWWFSEEVQKEVAMKQARFRVCVARAKKRIGPSQNRGNILDEGRNVEVVWTCQEEATICTSKESQSFGNGRLKEKE
nr:glyoxalase I, glyoxalase/bleomycin resistance protein/dihydroxybiphenyl dioxygenase [Tanacetum cinerariifolium]